MARYTCCGCDVDMTNAVEDAFKRMSDGELVTTSDLEVQETKSVRVTCPNGHTCTYTR
jgi:hypothetical protein